jgi:hypothetical protein
VGGGTVGLYDEALPAPEEVDLVVGDDGVDPWSGEAGVGDEGEEPLLELATGDVGSGRREGGEGGAEISRTARAPGSEHALDLRGIQEAQDLRAVAAPLELLGR